MTADHFNPLNLTVIGTGYVGLTTGIALAYLGHRVVGFDKDNTKIEMLKRGRVPIHEPGIGELLSGLRDKTIFTTDIEEAAKNAQVILIAVGTPQKENGDADTSYVEEAAKEIISALPFNRDYVLIIKSTVPVGTNRRVKHLVHQILAKKNINEDKSICVISNPEFLRESRALHDTFYPDRIVVGAESPEGVDVIRSLYQPILEQTFEPPPFLPRPEGYSLPPLITTNPTSAELIKYASNAFLALKISFINEIAGLCEKVGADVTEVARGIGYDTRIGWKFLQAGLGWGGSCFPKDTAALLAMGKEYNYEMSIIKAARNVNFNQRLRIVEKLQEVLKGVRGRVIGILGLAFKAGTDDIRDAPAIDIITALLQRGAIVRVSDPVALPKAREALANLDVEFADTPYAAASGADALVLVTEWPEYRQLDLYKLAQSMRTPVFLDGRNFFDSEEVRRAGFTYMGVGR